MAGLGALVVSISANTAQFVQSMDRAAYQAQRNFDRMTRGAKTVAGVFGASFAVGSIVSFAKKQLDAADALDKLSQKVGISVTELSRLQNAAELSGISAGELEASLKKFSISVVEASNKSDGQTDAFARLGIKVKDINGQLRPTEEVLYDVADAFASTADGARKTALAQELGKRGFENLIPLLNEGREGLKKYTATFNDDFAKAAVAFNDNITRLGQNFQSLAATILGPVVSAVNSLFGTPVGKDLDQAIDATKKRIEDLQESITTTKYLGKDGIFSTREKEIAKFNAQLLLAKAELVRLEALRPKAKPTTVVPEVDDSAIKKQEKIADIIKKQVDEYNALVFSKEQMVIVDLALIGATRDQIDQYTRAFEATKKFREEQEKQAKTQAEVAKLYEETRTPSELLNIELARLNGLLQTGAIDWDTYARAVFNAQDSFDRLTPPAGEIKKTQTVVEDLTKAIGTAFEDALVSGKSFRELLKGIEQDILRIITRRLVTNPLEKFITNLDFSSIFGGAKFAGGPVSSGKAYIVGEQGPEIFMPPVAGNIVPNGQTAGMVSGGGISVSNTFYLSAPADKRTQQQVAAMAGMSVQRAIARNT